MPRASLSLASHNRLDHTALYEHYMTVVLFHPDEFCEVGASMLEVPLADREVWVKQIDGWVSIPGTGGEMAVEIAEKTTSTLLATVRFQEGVLKDDSSHSLPSNLVLPVDSILQFSVPSVHSGLAARGLLFRIKLQMKEQP